MVHISDWICGSPPARPPEVSSAKAAVTGQHASVVSITGLLANDGKSLVRGIGLLIHPTLLLTTHTTIPSAACLQHADLTFCSDVSSLTYVKRKFVPDIFFQTNIDLDLTVVSCELVAPELTTLALDTSKLRRRAMRRGHTIFIMGCQVREAEEVAILEGKIAAMAGENEYVRFQTGDDLWMPGSAGFDEFGNFAFIVSKPPRLKQDHRASNSASSIAAASSNSSSSSSTSGRASSTGLFWRRPKQWGTTVYAAKEWLEPLWKNKRNELFRSPVQKPPRRPSAAMMEAVNKQKSFTPRSSSPVDSLASSSAVLAEPTSAIADSKENERKQPANIARIQVSSSAAQLEPPASKDHHKPAANAKKDEADRNDDDEDDEPEEELEEVRKTKRKPAGAATGKKLAQAKAGTKQVKTKPLQQKAGEKKKATGGGRKVKQKRRPAAEETAVQTEILIEEARVAPVVAVCQSTAETAEEGIQTDAVLEYVDAMLLATLAAGGRRRERWDLPEAAGAGGAGLAPKPIRLTSLKDQGGAGSPAPAGSMAAWVDAHYGQGRGRPNPARASAASMPPVTQHRAPPSPSPSPFPSSSSSSSEHNSSVSRPDPPVRAPLRSTSSSSSSSSSASTKARNSAAAASSSSVYSRPTISYMQKRSDGPARHSTSRSSTSQPRWS